MFRAFSCDSITVPSCDDHNTAKAGTDQAIVSALLLQVDNQKDRYPPPDDVLKAIEMGRSSFERTKRTVVEGRMLKDPPEPFADLPKLAYLAPSIDIYNWTRQLTAALVYDALQYSDPTIDWSQTAAWSPTWLSAPGPASIELHQAVSELERGAEIESQLTRWDWEEGWSAYPRPYPSTIYRFQLHFEPDFDVIFRHRFYSTYTWYNWFSASETTAHSIWRFAKEWSSSNPV
jgi:hypothetical protein